MKAALRPLAETAITFSYLVKVGSAEDFLEIGEDGFIDVAEILRAVVYVGAHHGVERLGIERGRARS